MWTTLWLTSSIFALLLQFSIIFLPTEAFSPQQQQQLPSTLRLYVVQHEQQRFMNNLKATHDDNSYNNNDKESLLKNNKDDEYSYNNNDNESLLKNNKDVMKLMMIDTNDCISMPKIINNNDYKQQQWISISKSLYRVSITIGMILMMSYTSLFTATSPAYAAPPFAVIAEELGYFPITDPKTQQTIFVPQRIRRASSEQSVKLASLLSEQNVILYGTYWCPHTSRQKELIGREAFQNINYVECASKGYKGNPLLCIKQKVDGYPAWYFPKTGEMISGERPLSVIAKAAGMTNFNEELEQNLPSTLGSESCKQ